MPSVFSWLDFAESDRQRAMQVIDLFREKSTVDELGFAPIRDAFADYLFPGTSTIQTRARYFLLVPWIFLRYKQQGLTVQELLNKVRSREARLITAIMAGGKDQPGIIGREAQGNLKRMPSSVYWRGLHQWGIRLFDGSIDQYLRRLARDQRGGPARVMTDDGEPIGPNDRSWHPALPSEPEGLYEKATLELSHDEAEFLRDRICSSQPNSMLAHVVLRAKDPLETDYAWDPTLKAMLPDDLRDIVEHARKFSLCAWGGPLIYSRMVAAMKNGDELVAQLEETLGDWQEQLVSDAAALNAWDHGAFWSLVLKINPRLSRRTREFAEQWIAVAMRAAAGERVWDDAEVQRLIIRRECQLKGGRARLRPENQRARDSWQGDAGGYRMDYRWGPTQVIVNDIVSGLRLGQDGGSGDA